MGVFKPLIMTSVYNRMQNTDVVHVHVTCTYHGGRNIQSSSTSETDRFYRFLKTLLRLLTKKVFINGNKRVATSLFTAV